MVLGLARVGALAERLRIESGARLFLDARTIRRLEVCHGRCAMAGVSFSMLSLG